MNELRIGVNAPPWAPAEDAELVFEVLEGDAVLTAVHACFQNTMVTLTGAVDLKVVYADRVDAGLEGLPIVVDRFVRRWIASLEAQRTAVGELVAP